MPFVQPTLSASSGARAGATVLLGSLAPIITPGFVTRIGANISAYPPLGVIGTTVSAGFNMGVPPRSASMLLVTVAGMATTSRATIETFGAWAHAHGELSITIEEWVTVLTAPAVGERAPTLTAAGRPNRRVPSRRVPPKLVRATTFSPTKIFDDWGALLSFQVRNDDGTPFTSVAGMPIGDSAALEHHSFIGWINLSQSAECQALSGYAAAVSNVAFDFPPPFFVFA